MIPQEQRNQLSNTSKIYQTNTKRVLCVCSAGLLRSPTLANVLHQEFGYNTRACGTSQEYALIPITEALIAWADEIVFVDKHARKDISCIDQDEEMLQSYGSKVLTLNIPDEYDWNHDELRESCLEQYRQIIKEVDNG